MRKTRLVKFLCSLFAAVMILSLFSAHAAPLYPVEPVIDSSSGIVFNLEKETVLFAKNQEHRIKPASFTKLMTALLAMEYRQSVGNQSVTVTEEMLSSAGGTSIKLKVGEIISLDDLLQGLVIVGANDAALVLASVSGGNIASFVEKMNERARALGMENTNYSNPTGVDSATMYTTLSDTLLLCRALYRINDFMVLARRDQTHIAPTNLTSSERIYTNRNALVPFSYVTDYYMEDVAGLSAGSTSGAGHCVAALRRKGGCTNFVLLSGGKDRSEKQNGTDISSYRDAKVLLEWAEENFSVRELLAKGEVICERPLRLASGVDHFILIAGESYSALLPKDADLSTRLTTEVVTLEEVFTAPIIEGDAYGTIELFFDGKSVGKIPLVARTNISRSGWLVMWDAVSGFFSQGPARVVLILIAVIAVLYVVTLIVTVWLQYARAGRARRAALEEIEAQEDKRLREVRLAERKANRARLRRAGTFLRAGYKVLSGEAELVETDSSKPKKKAPSRAVAKLPESYRRGPSGKGQGSAKVPRRAPAAPRPSTPKQPPVPPRPNGAKRPTVAGKLPPNRRPSATRKGKPTAPARSQKKTEWPD